MPDKPVDAVKAARERLKLVETILAYARASFAKVKEARYCDEPLDGKWAEPEYDLARDAVWHRLRNEGFRINRIGTTKYIRVRWD